MKSRIGITGAIVLASLAVAPPLLAQYSAYTTPGSLSQLPEDRKAGVAQAAEKARWRLGPFRIEPWVGVRDMAWVDDGQVDADGRPLDADLTTTVGAGARVFVRNGSKVTWAFHFLPEYVYWQKRDAQRRALGRYGAGIFADFNRLGVEITASRRDDEGIALAESFVRLPTRADEALVGLELKLTGALSLYAGGRESRVRSLADENDDGGRLRALDRDENALRGGLRFRFRSGLMLGAGYEKTESTSQDPAFTTSNTGDAIYVEASRYQGGYAIAAQVARRQLEPSDGSSFVATEDDFGRIQLQLRPEAKISPVLYASRDLLVAVDASSRDIVEDRRGASLVVRLGWRTTLTVFGEQGEQDYRSVLPGLAARRDDLTAYGAELRMELGRGLTLHAGYGESRYDSNLPEFDRDTTVLRVGLDLGVGASGWY